MSNEPQIQVEDLIGQQIPDVSLAATFGDRFGLRQEVGRRPLVLFFYIRNGTPG